ncbi:hypothetical protein DPMN_111500 [Dreissena polymorpha]|uniref:Uncharacterized protein n=1 Tax=Dreissena polymorpha TaxID=45954 RepID=A0A9D4QP20_DREPO|nr:hypothetical protein DPMN_111500 [Dreissena polymorpha]
MTHKQYTQYLQLVDCLINRHHQISVRHVMVHARVLGQCPTRRYRLIDRSGR